MRIRFWIMRSGGGGGGEPRDIFSAYASCCCTRVSSVVRIGGRNESFCCRVSRTVDDIRGRGSRGESHSCRGRTRVGNNYCCYDGRCTYKSIFVNTLPTAQQISADENSPTCRPRKSDGPNGDGIQAGATPGPYLRMWGGEGTIFNIGLENFFRENRCFLFNSF